MCGLVTTETRREIKNGTEEKSRMRLLKKRTGTKIQGIDTFALRWIERGCEGSHERNTKVAKRHVRDTEH